MKLTKREKDYFYKSNVEIVRTKLSCIIFEYLNVAGMRE